MAMAGAGPVPGGTPAGETKVIYHLDEEETPYLVKIPVPAERITLGHVKAALARPGAKYFFKSMDQDFGCGPGALWARGGGDCGALWARGGERRLPLSPGARPGNAPQPGAQQGAVPAPARGPGRRWVRARRSGSAASLQHSRLLERGSPLFA